MLMMVVLTRVSSPKARRKVVLSFALSSLPFHLRKLLQYYWPRYDHSASSSFLLTALSFLLMYANSAVNPVLYTFMSNKFRTSSRDLLTCRLLAPKPQRAPQPRAPLAKPLAAKPQRAPQPRAPAKPLAALEVHGTLSEARLSTGDRVETRLIL